MPKVSIIIPVYNVEAYLRECLDSAVQQSLQDIEIVIVNDASPDNSQDIIDEYVAKDTRIIAFLHEKNKKQGGARNTGIEAARGEYLMFLDSDDVLHPYACEVLYAAIKEQDADLIQGPLLEFENTKPDITPATSQNIVSISGTNEIVHANIAISILSVVGGKMYHSHLWKFEQIGQKKLRFPENTVFEDEYLILEILFRCKKVLLINQALYYYRQHQNSITNCALSNKAICDLFSALAHRKEIIFKYGLPQVLHDLEFNFHKWAIKERCFTGTTEIRKTPSMLFELFCYAKKCGLKDEFEQAFEEFWEKKDGLQNVHQDRWYRFGRLPAKRKLWVIAKHLSKKLRIYKLLQPVAKSLRQFLKLGTF